MRHPWTILGVDVSRQSGNPVLRLTAAIRRERLDAVPAALVVARMTVGAAVEVPLVFWTLLLLWPVRSPHRPRWPTYLRRALLGLPIFLFLDVATTVAPLLSELPATDAVLAGAPDRVTATEWWGRFLEAGGRTALEVSAALLALAAASMLENRHRAVTSR
jgi:hypothetical protein